MPQLMSSFRSKCGVAQAILPSIHWVSPHGNSLGRVWTEKLNPWLPLSPLSLCHGWTGSYSSPDQEPACLKSTFENFPLKWQQNATTLILTGYKKKKAIFLKNIRDFWPLKNKIVDTLSCHFSLWTWKTCLPTMVYWTPGSYRVISLSRYWCFRNEIKDWLFSSSLCFAEDAHVLYWPY